MNFIRVRKNALLSDIDARIKTFVAIFSIFMVLLLENVYVLSALLSASYLLLAYYIKSWKKFFKHMIIPLLIGLFVFLAMIYTYGSTEIYYFLFPIYLEGIHFGIIVFLRILLSISMLNILIHTTDVHSIIDSLKWFRVPDIFVNLVGLVLRYIIVLGSKVREIKMAIKARGGFSKLIPWKRKVSNIAMGAGALMVQSFEMSSTIHKAMLARGYNPEKSIHSNKKLKMRDVYYGIISIIIVCTIVFVDYRIGGLI